MTRLPVISLVICIAAVMVFNSTLLSSWMVFDRELILSGELWRLFTGHLAHWSASHLMLDLVAFLISAWFVESALKIKTAMLYITMALLISMVLLIGEPTLHQYGGLSGLAYGNVLFAALRLMTDRGVLAWLAGSVLVITLGRLLLSFQAFDTDTFSQTEISVITVPLAHLTGMLCASVFYYSYHREKYHVII